MRLLRIGHPGCALVIAPHADDETIGAWGLIRALRARGAEVRILVVSDGAGSHRDSRLWPPARLIAERRRETQRVMRRLGIGAGSITCLGLPDGGLDSLSRWEIAPLARAIRRVRRLALLVAPTDDDAHPDHRAVARAVAAVWTPGARRLAYRVWPDRSRPPSPARYGLTIGTGRSAKRAAILAYRTQTGAISDDPAGFAISRCELAAFAGPVERYREERR